MQEEKLYSLCSDSNIRAIRLKLAHKQMKELDAQGLPTYGQFGKIQKEESKIISALAKHAVGQNACELMTWDQVQQAREEYMNRDKNDSGG